MGSIFTLAPLRDICCMASESLFYFFSLTALKVTYSKKVKMTFFQVMIVSARSTFMFYVHDDTSAEIGSDVLLAVIREFKECLSTTCISVLSNDAFLKGTEIVQATAGWLHFSC